MSMPRNEGGCVNLTSTFCSVGSIVWEKGHAGHFLKWKMDTVKSTTWIVGKCESGVLTRLVEGKCGTHLLLKCDLDRWTKVERPSLRISPPATRHFKLRISLLSWKFPEFSDHSRASLLPLHLLILPDLFLSLFEQGFSKVFLLTP